VDSDPTAGQNPPYGAAINYYLKSAPAGDVKIRIEDAKGQTVRILPGTKTAGINRIVWDLRGEQTKEVRLRTSPVYAPEIGLGPEGWRTAPGAARMSVLLPPGTYTVKLLFGGQELSQPLVIRKDPNSQGTEAEINAQMSMLFELRKDMETAADIVNQIEAIRSQLYSITSLLGVPLVAASTSEQVRTESAPVGDRGSRPTVSDASAEHAAIKSAADALDKKLIEIEENLIQRKLTGQGQDTVRWPPKLISKINYLASGLAGSDFPPTTQQREVQAILEDQLATHRRRLDELISKDLDAFNRLLRDRGIQNVITRAP
jgi:hypothetical protein